MADVNQPQNRVCIPPHPFSKLDQQLTPVQSLFPSGMQEKQSALAAHRDKGMSELNQEPTVIF